VTHIASPKPVILVAAAVIEKSGTFLLAKRPAHKPQGGLWEFPGGKIEPGEDPASALARELTEELNAKDITVGALIGVSDFDYEDRIVRLLAYQTQCDTETLQCNEHEATAWVHPKDMYTFRLAPADLFLIPLLEK
jgi:mutator protein MutT